MAPRPSERWRRVDELFQTALDLPAEERNAFVDREAGADPSLAVEVREMLACASGAGERIGAIVGFAAAQVGRGNEWIGRRFGPYRVIREIGRGGMGIVFEAERDDNVSHNRVAIKVGSATGERFDTEREILAGLEHPHIARFLDGGSEAGVRYLVMEYVEGQSITRFCGERSLGVRERIEIFRRVCAAVHYAHEHMIVHRDLKPANILVNGEGEPKLLDFGIAKLLAAQGSMGGATTGMMMWTPDYTSPEQVRGGAVTARTDVYSLGLILYELLSGERGQNADLSSPMALDRSVSEAEPASPSVRAAAAGRRALSRELRGDLDTIVAMAIRKEPQRRYSSVAALSADLGRYLEKRPVEARPSTALYRLGKMVRRQRLASASAALVAAAIAGGVVSTVYQARRAERRFEQVRSLANAFIFDVHDRIQSLPGATEARRAIVSTALRYLENVRREAGSDAALRLELAAGYQRIGEVQGEPSRSNLGDTRGALASLRRAEELLTPLYNKGDVRAAAPLATVLLTIGSVRSQLNESAAAVIGELERARQIALRNVDGQPQDKAGLRLAVEIDTTLARQATDLQDRERALRAAEEGMQLGRRLMALDPQDRQSRERLSEVHSAMGMAHSSSRLDLAAADYRAAVALREELVREAPENAAYQRNLMMGYGHLGDVLGPPSMGLGDLAGAAEALRKAAAIAEWLCQADPSDRKAPFDLANADYRLGVVLLSQKPAEALSVLERAAAILAKLQESDPANANYRFNALYIARKIGEALAALRCDGEASRKMLSVIAQSEGFRGSHRETMARYNAAAAAAVLAGIRTRRGDRDGALAFANQAAAGLASIPPIPNTLWGQAEMYANLATVYRRMGQPRVAAQCLEKSVQNWRKLKLAAALEQRRQANLAVASAELAKLR